MNNPAVLVLVGVAVTALAFGFYVRWRKSSSAGSPSKAPAPATAPARLDLERPPLADIQQMFGASLAIGISLAILSMYLYADIPEDSPRWIALPFLGTGLGMVGAGSFLGSRLDRPSRMERIAGRLARRLGVDLVRIACLAGGVLHLIFAAGAVGFYSTDSGLAVIAAALAGGFALLAIGVFLPRLSQGIKKITGRGSRPPEVRGNG
jgi:hypothetical protein